MVRGDGLRQFGGLDRRQGLAQEGDRLVGVGFHHPTSFGDLGADLGVHLLSLEGLGVVGRDVGGGRLAAVILGQLEQEVLDLLHHPFVERGAGGGDLVEQRSGPRDIPLAEGFQSGFVDGQSPPLFGQGDLREHLVGLDLHAVAARFSFARLVASRRIITAREESTSLGQQFDPLVTFGGGAIGGERRHRCSERRVRRHRDHRRVGQGRHGRVGSRGDRGRRPLLSPTGGKASNPGADRGSSVLLTRVTAESIAMGAETGGRRRDRHLASLPPVGLDELGRRFDALALSQEDVGLTFGHGAGGFHPRLSGGSIRDGRPFAGDVDVVENRFGPVGRQQRHDVHLHGLTGLRFGFGPACSPRAGHGNP